MISRHASILSFFLAVTAVCCFAGDTAKPAKLTELDRQNIIRAFMAENVFAARTLPTGKTGIRIVEGEITPSDDEVRQNTAMTGPAAKPGDRIRVTDVRFVKSGIIFELNGGPEKRKKWYEHIQMDVGGVTATRQDPDAPGANPRGSFVLLGFKDYTPSLTPDQIKEMLLPVLDFKAQTVAEAYVKALPPKLADAVKNHRVLVGMDREMVTYTMGRPPKRYRDRDGSTDYEEWIYGEPPKEVQFIRFVGEKVARVEIMAVDGQKIVRTQDEVGNVGAATSVATNSANQSSAQDSGRSVPSLMNPGEKAAQDAPQGSASPAPVHLPPGQTTPN